MARLIKYDFRSKYLRIHVCGIPLSIKYGYIYRTYVKWILRRRMRKKLQNISPKAKIRVGFLVSEQSKWGYQSVYDSFASDPRFEPVVLVTKLYSEHTGGTKHFKTMDDCIEFFSSLGLNTKPAYDTKRHRYIPLNEMGMDIIFYQQPWELDICQHPAIVSKYAITGYTSYGFELVEYTGSYTEAFHRWIDFIFTISTKTLEHMNNVAKEITNAYITGCTKLDAYATAPKSTSERPIIIYAPHHSFEENSLNLATFQFNANDILELAKQHSDMFDWVFKPHPRLKHAAITNHIMTEEQINQYYAEWEKLGTVCETGDYIPLFANSVALITDCCSFLAEYLPSGHPVFHLINKKARFNNAAKDFIGTYYQIYNTSELLSEFNRILLNNDDYKKAERLAKIPSVYDKNEQCGQKIYKICTETLNTKPHTYLCKL